jgi:hypothetical protein
MLFPLSVMAEDNNQGAMRMDSKHKVIFTCPANSMEEFRQLARQAAELGATHVAISDLPKSRWQWELDLNDPYPNWGMLVTSIFKVVVPEELKPFIPADYAKKNLQIVKERCAILKALGLKAAFFGKEPAWLPEAAYQAHPDWRGPRCEHPRRARHTYYAPCIDQPEVLAMYRKAVAELCRQAPIEVFSLLTNDSGGGICWSVSLYPGQNGPSWCEKRSYADRVIGFMSTIQDGARDAGLQAEVSMNYGSGLISQAEVASVIPLLKPGQALNFKTRDESVPTRFIGYNFYDNGVGPVLGIPHVFRVAEQLQDAWGDQTTNRTFMIDEPNVPEYFELVRQFRSNPTTTMIGRMQNILRTAEHFAGPENAHHVMQAWDKISRAAEIVRWLSGDPVMLVGTVNQRWINRPLVPFPMELIPEEKDYYRKYLFQANSEEEAADLMNLQGFEVINGFSGTMITGTQFTQAIALLQSAIDDIGKVTKSPDDQWAVLQKRVRTLICFYRNALYTSQYQDILDRSDYSKPPAEQNIYPMEGDQKLREIQIVTRHDIDNTNELIRLLETSRVPLVQTASTKEEEDIFTLGPDLIDQLKKKVAITLKHQLEVHRLYHRRQG